MALLLPHTPMINDWARHWSGKRDQRKWPPGWRKKARVIITNRNRKKNNTSTKSFRGGKKKEREKKSCFDADWWISPHTRYPALLYIYMIKIYIFHVSLFVCYLFGVLATSPTFHHLLFGVALTVGYVALWPTTPPYSHFLPGVGGAVAATQPPPSLKNFHHRFSIFTPRQLYATAHYS